MPAENRELPFDLPVEAVSELCRRYRVRELAVFGSALRHDFDAPVTSTF